MFNFFAFFRWCIGKSIDSDCIFYDNGRCSLGNYQVYSYCSGYYNCRYLKITREEKWK